MQKSVIIVLLAVVMLAGCARTNIQVDSQVNLPDQFEAAAQASGAAEVAQWWRVWNDEQLNALIEQGLRHNRNLAAMRANLQAAQANAALAAADLGPNLALTGGVGAHNVQMDNPLSELGLPAAVSNIEPRLGETRQRFEGHNRHIGFAASWEPDIFGGKRSDADAAHYAGLGTAEQWHGAQMLLASDIADHYFRVHTLAQRIRIGENSVAVLSRLQRYAQGRFSAGQARDNEVQEVAAKLSALRAQLATLQAQADASQRNIAVLSGQTPQGFALSPLAHDVLAQMPAAPSGQMPLEVLNRRPDVRAQANAVKAMSAKLASARADLLPRFDIQFLWQSGRVRVGSDAPTLKGLGGLVSAGVTLPLFTAGRIQRNIEAADARLQAALAQYDHSVLTALGEVDSSYQLQYSLHRQSHLLDQAAAQARRQADGAQQLFRYGHITLERSLNARLNAENLADQYLQSRLAEAQNMLRLYKALGGGWSAEAALQ